MTNDNQDEDDIGDDDKKHFQFQRVLNVRNWNWAPVETLQQKFDVKWLI